MLQTYLLLELPPPEERLPPLDDLEEDPEDLTAPDERDDEDLEGLYELEELFVELLL